MEGCHSHLVIEKNTSRAAHAIPGGVEVVTAANTSYPPEVWSIGLGAGLQTTNYHPELPSPTVRETPVLHPQ